jgi:hypothetical protein
MNIQMTLLTVFFIVVVAATCYYTYINNAAFNCKIQAHDEMLAAVMGRFDNIESIFMRPPIADVESIFEKPPKSCVGNICKLTPITEESDGSKNSTKKSMSNQELDDLAKKELSELDDIIANRTTQP